MAKNKANTKTNLTLLEERQLEDGRFYHKYTDGEFEYHVTENAPSKEALRNTAKVMREVATKIVDEQMLKEKREQKAKASE